MHILLPYLFMSSSPLLLLIFLVMTKKTSFSMELFSSQNYFSDLTLAFQMDYLSLIFFFAISTISAMVLLYSKFYMEMNLTKNTDKNRFSFILLSFILSMMVLVFSNSWVTLMLGWDGLGLSSFLLVVFYSNSKSLSGGLLTFLTNRFGDALFIVTFMNMNYIGWVNMEFLNLEGTIFFFFLITLGAMTKSAQYPFCSWLPAAMAAPTPVSSLVHSSTLVTAGVYVLIRLNFLLKEFLFFLSVFSLATMVISGVTANFEMDFKKIIAMSTLSQLGFMVFTISLGFWKLAFFHVLFHAFFKSSLFLSTGSLMHETYSIQDSRLYGNSQSSNFSKIYFISCCISLMGFPFTLGFFSKDSILSCLSCFTPSILVWVFIFSCCLTISYSIRIIYLSFQKSLNSTPTLKKSEEGFFIFPILLLVLIKTMSGSFFFLEFFSLGVFSFLECSLGLLILGLGLFLSYAKAKNFLNYYFFANMTFLSTLFSHPFTSLNQKLKFSNEMKWGEISGGLGVIKLLTENLSVLKKAYTIHIFPILLLTMIFLLI